jgi:hypothetical protein
MGIYNPRAPLILGEEWVPIREESTLLTPTANTVEYGTRFTVGASATVSDARFYVKQPIPDRADRGQTFMIAAYSLDGEVQMGPVRRVVIPCNSVVVSGGTVSSNAPNAVEALFTGSTSTGISLNTGNPSTGLAMGFATSMYPQLNGKRILGVNLLSAVTASSNITGPTRDVNTSQIQVSTDPTLNSAFNPQVIFGRLRLEREMDTTAFGEINQFWTANSPNATADRVPWTWAQLLRLDTTSPRLYTKIETGTNRGTTSSNSCYVYYAALEVFFCEEKRVILGATQFGPINSTFGAETVIGANKVLLHDLAGNLNPTLSAGRYLLVVSSADVGGINDELAITSAYPELNALRQKYEIPSHPSYQVNIPFPMDPTAVGKEFVVEPLDILPQLSLHLSSGAMQEPHVYGKQAHAQVFGSITATQEIGDGLYGSATTWPQVRYYARRFGNTTVPLLLDSPAVTGSGRSVYLTPAEWDALPELIDGWKEITKRFATAPTMGTGTNPQWRFSAANELSGNRWEVLGAIAPAISGVGGNLQNQVISQDRLGIATYGSQSAAGTTINLGWIPGYSPVVTATTDDQSADAVLMFSQDPATITGVSVATTTQALTGFVECTHGPCCIPSALQYNRVTWQLPANTAMSLDYMDRTTVTGFGTPDLGGGPYTYTDSQAAYTMNGSEGLITPTATAVYDFATFPAAINFDITAIVGTSAPIVAGSAVRVGVVGRYTDVNNYYMAWIQTTQSTGASIMLIEKNVAGVSSFIVGPYTSPVSVDGAARVNVRFMGELVGASTVLKFKTWALTEDEPPDWALEITDGSLTTGSRVGVVAQTRTLTGNTLTFDRFINTPPRWNFGALELQRRDSVGNVWETIMLSPTPAITGFNDYEARVGVTSQYQLRNHNVLDFTGPWSATGSGTLTEPGVTMPSCGTSKRGVLIFTSNEVQSGASNLAYAMTWDSEVVEDFSFPEVNQLDIQPYLDRDYQVAFHGTERGGEQFSRRLLIANAATALPRMGHGPVKSISDLAWRDLAYVCVRDDIGDRWYAVIVISGDEVRRNRRLYNASLSVIEVSGIPSQVAPTWP